MADKCERCGTDGIGDRIEHWWDGMCARCRRRAKICNFVVMCASFAAWLGIVWAILHLSR